MLHGPAIVACAYRLSDSFRYPAPLGKSSCLPVTDPTTTAILSSWPFMCRDSLEREIGAFRRLGLINLFKITRLNLLFVRRAKNWYSCMEAKSTRDMTSTSRIDTHVQDLRLSSQKTSDPYPGRQRTSLYIHLTRIRLYYSDSTIHVVTLSRQTPAGRRQKEGKTKIPTPSTDCLCTLKRG